jgi:hypothetical protein
VVLPQELRTNGTARRNRTLSAATLKRLQRLSNK